MFAAALPQPAHNMPGGTLATGIRDALTAASFRAHMVGQLPTMQEVKNNRAVITSPQSVEKAKRPRKRRKATRSIAEDAFLMTVINRAATLDSKGNGITPEQRQIADALRGRAQRPVEAIKADLAGSILSWRADE